jgi:hypothetical protein
MLELLKFVLLLVAVFVSSFLGYLRYYGEKGEIFQALAHLWVGGLFIATIAYRSPTTGLALLYLTVLEILCFFNIIGVTK